MRFFKRVIHIFIFLLALVSCDLSGGDNSNKSVITPPAVEPDNGSSVYIAGQREADKHGQSYATYWANGSEHKIKYGSFGTNYVDMDVNKETGDVYVIAVQDEYDIELGPYEYRVYKNGDELSGYTTPGVDRPKSIKVVNSNIYMGGDYLENYSPIPAYWVNGVRHDLSTDSGYGSVTSIDVYNEDIYVAVVDKSKSYIWKNDTLVFESNSSNNYKVNKIFANQNEYYYIANVDGHDGLYKNNALVDFSLGTSSVELYDAVFFSSNILVVGTLDGTSKNWIVNISTDNVITADFFDSGIPTSVSSNGQNIYFSGKKDNVGTYWVFDSSEKVTSYNLGNNQSIYSISKVLADDSNNIYLGYQFNEIAEPSYGVYWKDGVEHAIKKEGYETEVLSIFAKDDDLYLLVSSSPVGRRDSEYFYYVNGVEYQLQGQFEDVEVIDILVNSGNVYVIGSGYDDSEYLDVGIVWKNGVPTTIVSNNENDIYIYGGKFEGNDLYVYGYEGYKLASWKNGVLNGNPFSVPEDVDLMDIYNGELYYSLGKIGISLPRVNRVGRTITYGNSVEKTDVDQEDISLKDMLVSKSGVYICGSQLDNGIDRPFILKDGTISYPSSNYLYGEALKVVEFENNIYTLGKILKGSSEYSKVVYWKDGKETEISTGEYYVNVRDIFVK